MNPRGVGRKARYWFGPIGLSLVLVAAACGSSSKSTTGSTASSGSSGASTSAGGSAATGKPILIGGQGDLAIEAGITQGFEARINAANKAGGIDGRPIKFVGMLDDALSPQTNLTNSQKLVENDHVVAVAPYGSAVCTASGTGFLAQNSTPFVGWAVCGGWIGSKFGIGINGAQSNPSVQSDGGMIQLITALEHMPGANISKPSDVKLALIGYNTAGGTFATGSLAAAARAQGIDVVYAKAPIPETATNFAPYAQAVVASGANAVYEITDQPLSIGISAGLKAAGFKGFMLNGVTYFPGQLSSNPTEQAALDGVGVESEFPVNEDATPVVKTAQQQLAASGFPTDLTSGTSIGYWSGDVLLSLLQATAARVGVNNITGAALQATAAGGWTYNGGLGKMTYPQAWTTPTGCGTLVQQEGTSYKLLVQYQCYSQLTRTGA